MALHAPRPTMVPSTSFSSATAFILFPTMSSQVNGSRMKMRIGTTTTQLQKKKYNNHHSIPSLFMFIMMILLVNTSNHLTLAEDSYSLGDGVSDEEEKVTCKGLIEDAIRPPPDEIMLAEYYYNRESFSCSCDTKTSDNMLDDSEVTIMTYSLSCDFCPICTPSEDVCAKRTSSYILTTRGSWLDVKDCITYTKGRDEEFCSNLWWDEKVQQVKCKGTIDGIECKSCMFKFCNNEIEKSVGTRLLMDCTNIEPDAIIDRCIEDFQRSNPHNGIFTIFNDNVVCQDDGNMKIDGATSNTNKHKFALLVVVVVTAISHII